MELKYQCPVCGTPLGYQGLCWKCRAAQDRAEVAAWSLESTSWNSNTNAQCVARR